MQLAVSLTQKQVNHACRVHRQLTQWCLSDLALEQLGKKFRNFSPEACLLKTVAVNAIYGTRMLATVRMAKHIEGIFSKCNTTASGADLVERIAALPPGPGAKSRREISFASKFCHFFVNSKIPIYDGAAKAVIKLHLGTKACATNKARPYLAFCTNFNCLRRLAKLKCKTKELDHYLWLTGMYMRWLKQRSRAQPRVNAELRRIFGHPSRTVAAALDAMLPPRLPRTFKAKR